MINLSQQDQETSDPDVFGGTLKSSETVYLTVLITLPGCNRSINTEHYKFGEVVTAWCYHKDGNRWQRSTLQT